MTALMVAPTSNIPTIFLAFGATGDLMRRKVIPSLFYLHKRGELPHMFRVAGFSRREWTDEEYQKYIGEIIEEHAGEKVEEELLASFCKVFRFQNGEFEDDGSYDSLKKMFDELDGEWGVCSNKLFYLAVAPEYYEIILKQLAQIGRASCRERVCQYV